MNLELINSRIASAGFPFVLTESDFDDDFHRTRDKLWYRANKVYLKDDHLYVSVYGGDYRDQARRLSVTITFNELGLEVNEANHKSKREIAKLRKKAEKELSAQQIATMIQAQDRWVEWSKVQVQELSSYEKKKGIPHSPSAIVIKNFDDNQRLLAIPMFDDAGEIWNIQTIYATGKKLLMGGGKKLGLHHTIHGLTDTVYVCEGFATGVAINAATGRHVIVAFDAGNLEHAYLYAKKHHDVVIIAADWDGETFTKIGKNPGMFAAREIAIKHGAHVAVPTPKQDEALEANLDFADLWPDADRINQDLFRTVSPAVIKDYTYDTPKPKAPKKKKPQGVSTEGLEASMNESSKTHQQETPKDTKPVPTKPTAFAPPPIDDEVIIDPDDYPTMADGFFHAITGKQGIHYKPDYDGFSAWIKEKHRFVASDGFTYIYKHGYFQPLTKLALQNFVTRNIRTNSSPNEVRQFCEAAINANYIPATEFKPKEGFINLANGVLEVKTRKLWPHSPTFYFTYKLKHSFVPGAECPNWQGFLMDVFEGNEALANVAAEMFGYVLAGGTPFLHKTFVLEGTGRNGKSTMLDVLRELVGIENVSHVRLEDFERPFSVIQAQGKLVNLIGEASKGEINSDLFKAAAAGESLTAAHKYGAEFPMPFFARNIIACNKLPYLGDTTVGAQERLYILPFDRYFKDEERIVNFAPSRLFPEIPGILMWALDGLDRVMARGRLPKIEAVEKANRDMRLESDTFFVWWSERILNTTGKIVPESRLRVSELFLNYRSWCEEERKNSMNKFAFSKKLRSEVVKDSTLKWSLLDGYPYVRGHIALVKNRNNGGGFSYDPSSIPL